MAPASASWAGRHRADLVRAGLVLLGSVLVVVTAIQQPYNENEWLQIGPYGSTDPAVITSGTRQPPLDPLLGSLVQHLLGEGQLRQRLVPVLCGIGSLVLMALLLRRLRTGPWGLVALAVLATAPVFLRYSAYIRPYALPVTLMLLACWAGSRWLDDGRRRWLVAAAVAALLLPLARVPEPLTFLGTSVLVLAVAGWRRMLPRRRSLGLAATFVGAMATSGLITFTTLRSRTSGAVFDPHPGRVLERAPKGLHELGTALLPLLADWLPWWPVTLLLVVLGAVVPGARWMLLRTWYWWPLLAAPVVFVLAYHFLNPYPLDYRPYRPRFIYFFAPPLALLVAAVGHGLADWTRLGRRRVAVAAAVVGAVVAGQLPAAYTVLTENHAVDYGMAGDVLHDRLPADALVLYDSPSSGWRQPFSGRERYVGDHPQVLEVSTLASRRSARITTDGPVHLLLLDSRCASSVVCDTPGHEWSHRVPGFEMVARFDRFRLYAPTRGQHGVPGALQALRALTKAYGPEKSTANVLAAARLLKRSDRQAQAWRAVEEHCATQSNDETTACLQRAAEAHVYPQRRVDAA